MLAGNMVYSVLLVAHAMSECSTICYQVGLEGIEVCFLGYSRHWKGYQCYSAELGKYVMSTYVVFSKATPFFYASSISSSQGEEDYIMIVCKFCSPIQD